MKNSNTFTVSFLCLFIFISSMLIAQDQELTGVVISKKGDPLQVYIKIKGEKNKIRTNEDGTFKLICKKDNIVFFYAKDFITQKVKLKGRNYIEVIMESSLPDYNSYNTMVDLIIGEFPGQIIVDNGVIKVKHIGIEGTKYFIPMLVLDELEVANYRILSLTPSKIRNVELLKDPNEISKYSRNNVVIKIETNL